MRAWNLDLLTRQGEVGDINHSQVFDRQMSELVSLEIVQKCRAMEVTEHGAPLVNKNN